MMRAVLSITRCDGTEMYGMAMRGSLCLPSWVSGIRIAERDMFTDESAYLAPQWSVQASASLLRHRGRDTKVGTRVPGSFLKCRKGEGLGSPHFFHDVSVDKVASEASVSLPLLFASHEATISPRGAPESTQKAVPDFTSVHIAGYEEWSLLGDGFCA